MIVLGLTGSIGMGKTTAARMLRRMGIPVHDADAAVHRLLARGGAAVRPIAVAFAGTVRDGAVDRQELGRRVFGDPAALGRLERIVHPLVRRSSDRFLAAHRARRTPIVVLDVPLLYEKGGVRCCDRVIVVSAPAFLQRQRVLRRPGMTQARFAGILAQQMPDVEKRRRADAVVPTGLGKGYTWHRLAAALRAVRRRPARRSVAHA
ncbi:MAG: dephospho-CoA kinase [Alphaproteobacteria bacterium]|nr:dephospho-CoA kinase [Alphaproteobacteria bacterium]